MEICHKYVIVPFPYPLHSNNTSHVELERIDDAFVSQEWFSDFGCY